jgi:hypothetical protein
MRDASARVSSSPPRQSVEQPCQLGDPTLAITLEDGAALRRRDDNRAAGIHCVVDFRSREDP